MDPTSRMFIEHECAKLTHLYCRHLDHRDPEGFANLYAKDAQYKPATLPEPVVGRDAILAWFHTYPADRFVRHLTTNVLVEVTSDTTARGTSYAITFREADPQDGVISDKSTPRAVVEYNDTYRLTEDGWKFQTRFYNIDFLDGGERNRPRRTTSI